MSEENGDKILERIFTALEKANISFAEMERDLHLSPKTVSNWRRGKSHGYLRMIPEIAAYFGIATEALVQGNDSPLQSLTAEEQELLSLYRRCSDFGFAKRKALRDTFRGIVELYLKK